MLLSKILVVAAVMYLADARVGSDRAEEAGDTKADVLCAIKHKLRAVCAQVYTLCDTTEQQQ